MVEKKKQTKVNDEKVDKNSETAVKLRGRTFKGEVINKLHGRVKIEFQRVIYDRKYERYDKRRTRLHARVPKELEHDIQVGDWIEIKECRPLSKIIHFIVTKKIRSKKE